MTNLAKYYVWLTLALGFSGAKPKAIHDLYSSVEEFYKGGEAEWRLSGVLKPKDIEALSATPIGKALEVIARCNELGVTLISLDDPDYPERLTELPDPPAVLYVKGRLPDLSSCLSVAMVGTRNATAYGKRAAHVLAGSLAKVGVAVISGGAVGIDSMAHTGALEAGGVTLCVLGCGIDFPYLTQNRRLRDNIAVKGAVISEYPPDYPPGKYTFPERNRIISGLSDGVVVVEAGEKSGSLITARLAAEQGRDVFAVMGNITSPYSKGANALIKDGAIPVTDFTDIIDNYPRFRIDVEPDDIVDPIPRRRFDIELSPNAAAVYLRVQAEPLHIDAITSASGLPVKDVLRAVTELELEGLIKAEKGRMYRLL